MKGRFKRIIGGIPRQTPLREETKIQILNSIGIEDKKSQGFLREFEWLIGEYRVFKNLEESEPGKRLIRDGIAQLYNESQIFTQHLYLSREATGGLLDEALTKRGVDAHEFLRQLRRDLANLNSTLLDADELASELPNKPIEQQSARRWLAIELAKVFQGYLNLTPTSTPGGAFEVCLSLLLEEAIKNNPDRKGIDRLTRYAVNNLHLSP